MVVHHIPPRKSALYVAFTSFLVQHLLSILSAKIFWRRGEALNDKEIYLKSDRGTQLVL